MNFLNTPHMISISMCADKCGYFSPTNCFFKVRQYSVFIIISNVAITQVKLPISGSNENHVSLSNVNEMNFGIQGFLLLVGIW